MHLKETWVTERDIKDMIVLRNKYFDETLPDFTKNPVTEINTSQFKNVPSNGMGGTTPGAVQKGAGNAATKGMGTGAKVAGAAAIGLGAYWLGKKLFD